MSYREKDILYEVGSIAVVQFKGSYDVLVPQRGLHYSITDSAYAKTADGLSIAKARADYLAGREKQ